MIVDQDPDGVTYHVIPGAPPGRRLWRVDDRGAQPMRPRSRAKQQEPSMTFSTSEWRRLAPSIADSLRSAAAPPAEPPRDDYCAHRGEPDWKALMESRNHRPAAQAEPHRDTAPRVAALDAEGNVPCPPSPWG